MNAHNLLGIAEVADHWFASNCTCGWESNTRWTRSHAAALWLDHNNEEADQ